jgi:hypothetical protein
MFYLTDVRAAGTRTRALGKMCVEQVAVADDSVVALSDFNIVITSDDLNTVDRGPARVDA